jgi:hypothetical protein
VLILRCQKGVEVHLTAGSSHFSAPIELMRSCGSPTLARGARSHPVEAFVHAKKGVPKNNERDSFGMWAERGSGHGAWRWLWSRCRCEAASVRGSTVYHFLKRASAGLVLVFIVLIPSTVVAEARQASMELTLTVIPPDPKPPLVFDGHQSQMVLAGLGISLILTATLLKAVYSRHRG